MEIIQPIFYRNGKCLSFKVVDKVSDIKDYLPTIVLYANNGQYVYQPYVLKEVEYVKDINKVKGDFELYFVLRHDIYKSDKLETILKLIETDLKSGDYFPFGEINKDPFSLE